MGQGNVVGKTNSPTASLASGVWGLREQHAARQGSAWPVAPAASVAYDTVSSGKTTATDSNPATVAWNHTLGGNTIMVLVAGVNNNGAGSTSASVTIDGVGATSLLVKSAFNPYNSAFFWLFGLTGLSAGTKAISTTVSGATQGAFNVSIAASYSNVAAFSTVASAIGATSLTAGTTGNVVVAGMAGIDSLSTTGGTQRGSNVIQSPIYATMRDSTGSTAFTASGSAGQSLVAVVLT